MIRIRAYQPSDKDQLRELVIESNLYQKQRLEQESLNVEEVQTGTARIFNQNIEEKNFQYIVAEDNQKLVGFVLVEVSSMYVGKGSIDDLYLRETYRGQGIGKKLVQAAIDWLKQKNIQSVSLAVHKTNQAAIKLYTEFGFTDESESYRYLRKELT